jgi:hypothetical protein
MALEQSTVNDSQENGRRMFTTKLAAMLAVSTAVAVSALSAGVAHAAKVDNDSVRLSGSTLDFGSLNNKGGIPTDPGDLDWNLIGGQYSAHLTGGLYITHSYGSCARMRMEYFDDGTSIATEYGGTVCPSSGDTELYGVDLNPYADADIDLVKVSLQQETASGGWSIVDSAYFSPTIPQDWVQVTGEGADFGDQTFSHGEPSGTGWLSWGQGEDGTLTPHLTGTLHLDGKKGRCARMNLRYYAENGDFLTEKPGGTVCAPDSGHHAWSVDLAPYTSNKIAMVTVEVQSQRGDGSWDFVGSDKVYIDYFA